jgi:hypothetical protein
MSAMSISQRACYILVQVVMKRKLIALFNGLLNAGIGPERLEGW